MGLDIVKINTRHIESQNNNIDFNIKDAGPSEFIHLLSEAALILTTSFHGTAFAINFEKPFFTILSYKKKNNSRQIGLLEKVGLKSRILYEGTATAEIQSIACNFIDSTTHLNQEKGESLEYLMRSIESKVSLSKIKTAKKSTK
jgi:hypothetical protein